MMQTLIHVEKFISKCSQLPAFYLFLQTFLIF